MLPTLVAVDGGRTIKGVALLGNLLYVLRHKSSEQIEVYDKDCYRLERCFTVQGLDYPADIAFCAHYRCGYICDSANSCIHRLALPRADVTQWPVNEYPASLSVTDKHSVLVTCCEARIIKEFTADGELIRELQLPESVTSPEHTIRLSSGQFIVCHGGFGDPIHRVCLIGRDGQVVRSYGEPKGSGSQQMDSPTHLAVDRKGYVFVADLQNCRVLLLSPSLAYIREIVSRDQLKGRPERLCLDDNKTCLYVAVGGRLVMVDLRNMCTLL